VLNSFFILKNHRRKGIGRLEFWRNVYESIRLNTYEKEEIQDGIKVIYHNFKTN
jgi:predicted acetyltransferase